MVHVLTAGVLSSPAPTPVAACFHCGLPVVGTGACLLPILGQTRALCCAGCEAVARTIVEAGLESYYETRDVLPALEAAPAGLPAPEIYDDPLAQTQFVSAQSEYEREALLVLDRIRCAACVWLNERYLRTLPGVLRVAINYTTRRAQISWDPRRLRLSAIIAAIRSLGYDAYPFDPARQRLADRAETRAALWRLFVAGFGAMQVMMYAVPRYIDTNGTLSAEAEQIMRWASLALTLPVIVFACGPFFSSALADLRARRLGIDVPISLGILAGFLASARATFAGGGEVYFDSITMLVFLLLGARTLEAGARRKAAGQLDRLARWMPAYALRLPSRDAITAAERVAAHELKQGDWVLVAAGDIIPADGVLECGAGSADESLLTGESRPVIKRAGSRLIGGSVNIEQPLTMRVTQVGAETRAAAIGRLIERAAAGKPRLVESADRVAHLLTWVVIACAVAAYAGWSLVDPARAFWVAVAVLVVTCPCALGLAAPIALTSATGALARCGVVLTRAQAVESLTGITDVVLDKTGTLTEGCMRMTQLQPLGRIGRDDCLDAALALEAGSLHPVACALHACATRASVTPPQQVVRRIVSSACQGVHHRRPVGACRPGCAAGLAFRIPCRAAPYLRGARRAALRGGAEGRDRGALGLADQSARGARNCGDLVADAADRIEGRDVEDAHVFLADLHQAFFLEFGEQPADGFEFQAEVAADLLAGHAQMKVRGRPAAARKALRQVEQENREPFLGAHAAQQHHDAVVAHDLARQNAVQVALQGRNVAADFLDQREGQHADFAVLERYRVRGIGA